MSDSEIKLFYAQSSEVSKRILAPDEHLRAIDTGAYYVAGPDGKPQAVLTATPSAQGVAISRIVAPLTSVEFAALTPAADTAYFVIGIGVYVGTDLIADVGGGGDGTLGINLANATDVAKGAALVGYKYNTVAEKLSEILTPLDASATTPNPWLKIMPGSGSGRNMIVFPDCNDIADDVSASTVTGGGNSLMPNLIGYEQSEDWISGNGSTNTFTTSFDATNTSDVNVFLVRADKVFLNVTASCDITMSSAKAQVVYPRAGHYVNDGTGGAEGVNAYLLSTQRIWIQRVTKSKLTGSNSSYCVVSGGYDNSQAGIMCQQHGTAHNRIKAAANHATQVGGSYNRMYGGTYGVQVGGTMGYHGPSVGSGAASVGGSGIEITGAGGCSLGGVAPMVSGARAVNLGGNLNVAAGSDACVFGNANTGSGAGSFTGGMTVVNSGNYSFAAGFGLTNSGGYSAICGRDNSNTKDYSVISGRYCIGRTPGARTMAGGRNSVSGDAQTQDVAMRITTADATATALQLVDGSSFANLPDPCVAAVSGLLCARDTSSGDVKTWSVTFQVKRHAGVTTASGAAITQIAADAAAAAWTAAVLPSNSVSGYRINVTGEAGKTIAWSAVFRDVCAG